MTRSPTISDRQPEPDLFADPVQADATEEDSAPVDDFDPFADDIEDPFADEEAP